MTFLQSQWFCGRFKLDPRNMYSGQYCRWICAGFRSDLCIWIWGMAFSFLWSSPQLFRNEKGKKTLQKIEGASLSTYFYPPCLCLQAQHYFFTLTTCWLLWLLLHFNTSSPTCPSCVPCPESYCVPGIPVVLQTLSLIREGKGGWISDPSQQTRYQRSLEEERANLRLLPPCTIISC